MRKYGISNLFAFSYKTFQPQTIILGHKFLNLQMTIAFGAAGSLTVIPEEDTLKFEPSNFSEINAIGFSLSCSIMVSVAK